MNQRNAFQALASAATMLVVATPSFAQERTSQHPCTVYAGAKDVRRVTYDAPANRIAAGEIGMECQLAEIPLWKGLSLGFSATGAYSSSFGQKFTRNHFRNKGQTVETQASDQLELGGKVALYSPEFAGGKRLYGFVGIAQDVLSTRETEKVFNDGDIVFSRETAIMEDPAISLGLGLQFTNGSRLEGYYQERSLVGIGKGGIGVTHSSEYSYDQMIGARWHVPLGGR